MCVCVRARARVRFLLKTGFTKAKKPPALALHER